MKHLNANTHSSTPRLSVTLVRRSICQGTWVGFSSVSLLVFLRSLLIFLLWQFFVEPLAPATQWSSSTFTLLEGPSPSKASLVRSSAHWFSSLCHPQQALLKEPPPYPRQTSASSRIGHFLETKCSFFGRPPVLRPPSWSASPQPSRCPWQLLEPRRSRNLNVRFTRGFLDLMAARSPRETTGKPVFKHDKVMSKTKTANNNTEVVLVGCYKKKQ